MGGRAGLYCPQFQGQDSFYNISVGGKLDWDVNTCIKGTFNDGLGGGMEKIAAFLLMYVGGTGSREAIPCFLNFLVRSVEAIQLSLRGIRSTPVEREWRYPNQRDVWRNCLRGLCLPSSQDQGQHTLPSWYIL